MTITLWHAKDTRSLRALWALEEVGLEYEVEVLLFPPRALQPDYLEVNPLGTVPFMVDSETTMTESSGICHYLVEKYQKHEFAVAPDHPDYGDYLNWLYHSDATLTFPQTIYLRYSMLEPNDRKQPQVAEDYHKWYLARLRRLNEHLEHREFLCADRFTIADIAIAYALFLGEHLGIAKDYEPQTLAYLERMKSRPAFKRAREIA